MKFLEAKNPAIRAQLLDAGATLGERPFIEKLLYDLEKLVVIVNLDVSKEMLRITFREVRGFRCLDEGDLTEFWQDELIRNNYFFEITSGGWFDQEAKREGFMSWYRDREFFICGVNNCVSVFADKPPKFEVIENVSDPDTSADRR